MTFETKRVGRDYDVLAPDGSEIRLLVQRPGGSAVHCTLPPGGVSKAVRHRTVEEIWYVVAGEGEIWRRREQCEQVDAIAAGTSLAIPLGAHFQFRNTGTSPLEILIATIPPWSGDDEAVRVPDHWPVDEGTLG